LNPTQRFLDEELVVLYQELLLNEFALMRSMELLFKGIPTKRGVYFISSYPALVDSSNPHRSFDLMALTYALYNGVRRALLNKYGECTYDLLEPVYWPTQCNILTLLRDFIRKLNPNYQHMSMSDPLEELAALTAELIKILVNKGLLRILLARHDDKNALASNSPLHLTMLKTLIELVKKNTREIDLDQERVKITVIGEISDYRDAVTLKNLAHLAKFYENVFASLNVRNDKLLPFFDKLLKTLIKELKLDKGVVILFKTAHGDLTRLVYISRPLPDRLTNFEGKILPLVAEPGHLDLCYHDIKGSEVQLLFSEFFEKLLGNPDQAKILTDTLVEALVKSGYSKLTCYQYEYLKELLNRKQRGGSIKAALTAPTGSGKTLVFLLYTVAVLLAEKVKNRKARAVFIYPRKALATDQLQKFVTLIYHVNELLKSRTGLNVTVTIGIRDSDSLEKDSGFTELRGLELEVGIRKLKLVHGINASKQYIVCLADQSNNCLQQISFIRDHKGLQNQSVYDCDILVTNHSMLNKHLTQVVSGVLQEDLKRTIEGFVNELEIVVVDEAHIYLDEKNSRLLQSVFLKIYFLKSSSNTDFAEVLNNIDLILSSATLTSSNIFDPKIDMRSIIGVYVFPQPHTMRSQTPDSVRKFFEVLTVKPPQASLDIIYYDYYETLIPRDKYSEALVRFSKPFKLRLSMFVAPYPYRSSWTSLNESLIAVLHWINALRRKLGIPYAALAFVDSRETLIDIMQKFNERQIREAEDHYDRILLTACSPGVQQSRRERREAVETIVNVLIGKWNGRSLLEAVWDLHSDYDYFSEFHALTNYIDFNNLHKYAMYKVPSNDHTLKQGMMNILSSELKFCDELKNYAEEVRRSGGLSRINLAKLQITPYYVIHHGGLEYSKRREVESLVRDGGVNRAPYIVSATSTLEVGVDFPNIIATILYGTDALPQEAQQRVGRSGRSPFTFYTSFGILIFRNTGDDLYYLGEREVVNYMYSIELKIPMQIIDDEYELGKHITSILLDLLENQPQLSIQAQKIMGMMLQAVKSNYNVDNATYNELLKLLEGWLSGVYDIALILHKLMVVLQKQGLHKAIEYIDGEMSTIDKNLGNISITLSSITSALQNLPQSLPGDLSTLVNAIAMMILPQKLPTTSINIGGQSVSVAVPRDILSVISIVSATYKKLHARAKQLYVSVTNTLIHQAIMNILVETYQAIYLLAKKTVLTLVLYLLKNPGKDLLDSYVEHIKKLVATMLPPGYVDPVSYTVDCLILYSDSEIEPYSFEDLVRKIRPLHTGE